jgi:hypothetical protein
MCYQDTWRYTRCGDNYLGDLNRCEVYGTKKCITIYPRRFNYDRCCPKCEEIMSGTIASTANRGVNPETIRRSNEDSGDFVVDVVDLLERGGQKAKGGIKKFVGSIKRTKTDHASQRSQESSIIQLNTDDIGDGGEKLDGYYYVAERLAERYRCLLGPHPSQINESTE